MDDNAVVILGGKRYIKPSQVARRLGVSRATIYRRLPKLQAVGVEVVRTSERVTLVNESDLERYIATTRLVADAAVRSLHALREAQRVQAIIRERHGLHQAGWAAEAVRQVREELGV